MIKQYSLHCWLVKLKRWINISLSQYKVDINLVVPCQIWCVLYSCDPCWKIFRMPHMSHKMQVFLQALQAVNTVNTCESHNVVFKTILCTAVPDCTLEGMHWHYQWGYRLNKNLLSTRGILTKQWPLEFTHVIYWI